MTWLLHGAGAATDQVRIVIMLAGPPNVAGPGKTPHYFPVSTGLSSAVSATSHVSYTVIVTYSVGYLSTSLLFRQKFRGLAVFPMDVDPIRSAKGLDLG